MPESGSTVDVTGRDVLTVERDGEQIEVYNHVSVSRHYYVNSVNDYEEFKASLSKGDMSEGSEPEAVTDRLARLLWGEFGITVEDRGIDVIDLADDEVTVL